MLRFLLETSIDLVRDSVYYFLFSKGSYQEGTCSSFLRLLVFFRDKSACESHRNFQDQYLCHSSMSLNHAQSTARWRHIHRIGQGCSWKWSQLPMLENAGKGSILNGNQDLSQIRIRRKGTGAISVHHVAFSLLLSPYNPTNIVFSELGVVHKYVTISVSVTISPCLENTISCCLSCKWRQNSE